MGANGTTATTSAISLGDVTPNNLGQLRRLHTVIFPVTYNDKFFKGLLETPDYARLAYFNDCAVGAVCAKREILRDGKDKEYRVYIMTLGVLAPYRQLGVGSELLAHIEGLCEADPSVKQLYVHMQVGNDDGLTFYRKKGFEVGETVPNYYKNITPTDAHVLLKHFHQ